MTMPVPHPEHFYLYDQTLSLVGDDLDLERRLQIAQVLGDLGVDLIEAPAGDSEFWTAAQSLPNLHRRSLVAAIAVHPDDAELQQRVPDGCEQICLTLPANLAATDFGPLLTPLVSAGLRVTVDLADYFDGLRADRAVQRERLNRAAEAGATTVVLCDSKGGTLPAQVEDAVLFASHTGVNLGVQFSNDAGCAVANTLIAADTGATLVKGSLVGVGQRAGAANLATVIANLQLKYGWPALPPDRIGDLTHATHRIADLLGERLDPRQPFVGTAAFVGAIDPHVDPSLVGNG